jgi:hypothetical protein
MMDDERLNELLRDVMPAGPAPGLRARALSARRPGRAWPWAAAAAAMLAVSLGLHAATVRTAREITQTIGPAEAESAMPELRAIAAGDEALLRRSALWTMQERRDTPRETVTP